MTCTNLERLTLTVPFEMKCDFVDMFGFVRRFPLLRELIINLEYPLDVRLRSALKG